MTQLTGWPSVNTHDLRQMPKHQIEALVYHEAVPGHHLQLALAQELQGIPMFRRLALFTAYAEGWGLYAERLAKDMGFYRDPYSDFGRLAFELRRATRLVLDTGIHAKRWTREQAIAFFEQNTPNPKGDSSREIERYIVAPGQATAYTIGMLKLLQLRERARLALGEQFDLRQFHEVVLGERSFAAHAARAQRERLDCAHLGTIPSIRRMRAGRFRPLAYLRMNGAAYDERIQRMLRHGHQSFDSKALELASRLGLIGTHRTGA